MSNNENHDRPSEEDEGSGASKHPDKEKGILNPGKPRLDPETADKGIQMTGSRTSTVTYAEYADYNERENSDLSWSPNSIMYVQSRDYIDFDDLLPAIGEFGTFQLVLFVFMIPFCFITAFVYLGQIFMTTAPQKYYCFVPQLSLTKGEELRKQLSIPREPDGSYSKCRMFDRNYTRIHETQNKTACINPLLPTVPCQHGYVFDTRDMPFFSATMEFGWLCEDDKYATYAQMVFFVGSIVGSMGYGHFADHLGRLAAVVSSCGLALLGSLATAMADSFTSFALSRFLVGASYDTCFTMVYILVHEYVGPRYRTLVANLSLALFYSPSTMLMPWIALFAGNWRRFSMIACLPIATGLTAFCVLPESARWLVSVGEIDKALDILKKVARVNKKVAPVEVFEVFKLSCKAFYMEELQGRSFTVLSIVKRPRMARNMILLILIWMSMSLMYDGYVRAASVLESENMFLFFTIACATELPGNILVILTLDRFGRRWCSFVFTSLSGICSLMGAGMKDLVVVRLSVLGGRFFANICYNIGLQWAAEILPTVVRAQGVSFIHTMGFAAMLMSPPVVYLSGQSTSLMLFILGGLGIFGALLALFLPETLNHELPQTLSDGNEFGRYQRIWHMPCCGAGRRRSQPKRYWHKGSSLRTLSRDEYRSSKLHRHIAYSTPRPSLPRESMSSINEKEIRTIKFNDPD